MIDKEFHEQRLSGIGGSDIESVLNMGYSQVIRCLGRAAMMLFLCLCSKAPKFSLFFCSSSVIFPPKSEMIV